MYPFGGEINESEKVIGFTEGFMNKHRLDGSAFIQGCIKKFQDSTCKKKFAYLGC